MAYWSVAGSLFTTVVLLFLVLTTYLANATPFILDGTQKPFQIPKSVSQSVHHTNIDGRVPCLDIALKSLGEASSQTIETFENVMSELGDVSKHMTWSLPQKKANARLHDWDFTVSTTALPEHSLRVKRPNNLGVDNVKQARPF
jgi:hypothetical protein